MRIDVSHSRNSASLVTLSIETIGTGWGTGGEALGDGARHAPRRARGIGELGMGRLERDELAEERVVRAVVDLGAVEHVVEVVVPTDLGAQPLDPGGGVRRGGVGRSRHARDATDPPPGVRLAFGAHAAGVRVRGCGRSGDPYDCPSSRGSRALLPGPPPRRLLPHARRRGVGDGVPRAADRALPAPPLGRRDAARTVRRPSRSSRSSSRSTTSASSSSACSRRSARIEWPADRLEVQLLDDSTDDTPEIAAAQGRRARGARLRRQARPPHRSHRATRPGRSRARPRSPAATTSPCSTPTSSRSRDFLRRTMDHFTDPSVGFVQTRWTYLNRDYGVLTRRDGDAARRPLRPRADDPQPRRLHLQLQRHRRRVAPQGHRRRGRLARRHDLRGHRPLLPREPRRIPRRLPARRAVPRRAARPDRGTQVPAAPVGEGPDRVLQEDHADAVGAATCRCARSSTPRSTSAPTWPSRPPSS